ncbi:M1 family metallopeptidase, partial [bacterium]
MTNNTRRGLWIAAIIGVVVIVTCLCVAVLGLGGLAFIGLRRGSAGESATAQVVQPPQQEASQPFATLEPPARPSTAAPEFPTTALGPGAQETLSTLQSVQIPYADLRAQAMEFLGLSDIPETVAFPSEFDAGDANTFWVLNSDTNRYRQVDTQLAFESPHVYFWVEKGLTYDESALRRLGDEFENKIYPTNREFFVSEWSPGVDGDPHLYIIYASDMGDNLAGMFSSADSVNPLAYRYSNGHETFFLNADNISLDEDFTYGVLAHEFQHMIHWYRDRNEETWMSEGFSELAAYLNGYDVGGFDYAFLMEPSTQLDTWPNDSGSNAANYGGAFLFLNYFLERFGEGATKELVGNSLNGLESIDQVLESLDATYPDGSTPYRADDLFADWTVANVVNDPSIADGRFGYTDYQMPFEITPTASLADCLGGWQTGSVNQYGTDYIELACSGQRTLQFEGASEVDLLPEDAHSGDYAFWSNQGDESRMALWHSFDLSHAQGTVRMSY